MKRTASIVSLSGFGATSADADLLRLAESTIDRPSSGQRESLDDFITRMNEAAGDDFVPNPPVKRVHPDILAMSLPGDAPAEVTGSGVPASRTMTTTEEAPAGMSTTVKVALLLVGTGGLAYALYLINKS